jgi:hypothetical protein
LKTIISLAVIAIILTVAVSTAWGRKWAMTDGTAIEAEIVKLDKGSVTLRKADGKDVSVTLQKFSEEDSRYLASLLAVKDKLQRPGIELIGVPYPVGESISFSSDLSAIAWVEKTTLSRERIVYNGSASDWFLEIGTLGSRCCVFSDDGKSFAYFAKGRDAKSHVVHDGKAEKSFEAISHLAISPDGKHLAYAAFLKDNRMALIVDGQEWGVYQVVNIMRWSPDSQHFAYIATDEKKFDGNSHFDVYVDKKRYGTELIYIHDHLHTFYSPNIDEDVKDDRLIFSPDSKRWAVLGLVSNSKDRYDAGGFAVMVDGKMHSSYPDIVHNTLTFSPDSSEILYAAGGPKDGDYFLVRNGKPGKPWNYINPGSIRFGNRGKSVGMIAFTGKREGSYVADSIIHPEQSWSIGTPSLVINDNLKAGGAGPYELCSLTDASLWIQHDDKKTKNGETARSFLIDGKGLKMETPKTGSARYLKFSPDGAHWICAFTDNTNQNLQLLCDGSVYSMPPQPHVCRLKFNGKDKLRVIAIYDRWLCQLDVTPAEFKKTK